VRVLAFGTYDSRVHPRIAVLIEGLRAHGYRVDECNTPLGLATDDRVTVLRQPWRVPGLMLRIAGRWASLVRDARRFPRPDVVLVGYLGHFDVVLARMIFRRSRVVLDHLISAADTATDRGFTAPGMLALLRRLDRRAIRSADVVVVDTDEHATRVTSQETADVVTVAVGAPDVWFAAGAEAAERRTAEAERVGGEDARPLRVVFFGLYTPLQGAPVIGTALQGLADEPIEVTMIGSGQDFGATVEASGAAANVTWLRWVDGAELPRLVAGHDVCLGIFGTGAKAQRVVPNKVFQGMAAGCVVVTSDTPPQRRALDDAAVLVPPGDPEALTAALRELAGDSCRVVALRERARKFALETMTPSAVTRPLVDRLGS
jgi:glycosyltransferase involved in cell wall biosynthesis